MATDALLPAAFLAGFFGGGHCFGMCGPLVVLFEQGGATRAWGRRLTYNLGRGTLYVLLGAAAGAIGLIVTRAAGLDAGLRLLRWLAAALVIAMGLTLLLDLPALRALESGGAALWRRLAPAARGLLPVRSLPAAFGAGLLWGFLPCGLVYSNLSLAAASGGVASGALVMLSFWVGTLPALLVAGASAERLAGWARRPVLRRIAGGLMIAIGLFAILLPMLRMHGA